MKSFKKFIALTLVPIFFIVIISIVLSKSLEDVLITKINIFVLGYFSIISFCYVYIFEKEKEKSQRQTLNYLFSSCIVLILTFLFSCLDGLFWYAKINLRVAVFQATLAVGIFLVFTFISEIKSKTRQIASIVIKEKPTFYLILLFKIVALQSVFIFILTTDSHWYVMHEFQVIDILISIIFFNLQVTLIAFIILAVFYNFKLFNRNVVLYVILASIIATLANALIAEFIGKNIYMAYINLLLICLFCCSSIVLILLHRAKIKNLTLAVSTKESEYIQLKNQVNPHFLFNNLNTLIAFIETNPKKAIEFGTHLSNIYRHYLKKENDDFVLLSTEIDFIKEYTAIFKAKFESGFRLEIENEATENQYVLSLCLQELIDNVFKHNTLDAENPIEIKISIFPDELVVRNTTLLKETMHSTKIGLKNINKRYKILTQKEVTIIDDRNYFEVKIPILNEIK
jgi:sensor histidine kinase YesM